MKNMLTISEAASYIGVSEMTLRRWDKKGQFKASFVSPGGHRYYSSLDLDMLVKGIVGLATDWAESENPNQLSSDVYCKTKDVFRTRLERMAIEMSRIESFGDLDPLVTSIVGEVGNNSFDHNVGNWPDEMGVFFAYDFKKRIVVLADRGRGVLATLRTVRPSLPDDHEALRVAFSEVLTGRAPEHRGNGLKYVRKVAERFGFHVVFRSGDAELEIKVGQTDLSIRQSKRSIRGCLCVIEF